MTIRHLLAWLLALSLMLLCGCPDEAATEICDDATDNDGDGAIDCDDSDCASWPGCEEGDDDDSATADDDDAGDDDTGCMDDDDSGASDDDDDDDDDTTPTDADGDGWDWDEDCDDNDPEVYPGADEVCDGKDNDCDPATDEDVDDDGDGLTECEGDCDDSDGTIPNSGVEDTCDGVDSDCDGIEEGPCTALSLFAADAKLKGAPCDNAGTSVAGAGDVNGDGYDDILVGAYEYVHGCDDPGTAYLVHGPVSGVMYLSYAAASFPGEDYFDQAGDVVASAGDVNGDGYDDLLITAPGHDMVGAVYLIHGPVSGERPLATADAKLTGEAWADLVSSSLSSADDVDGDGLADLLVGACNHDYNGSGAGAVYIVSGSVTGTVSLAAADATLVGSATMDCAGISVASAGDMSGDGLDDVLVGAIGHGDGGAAYLVHSPIAGFWDLSSADATLVGAPATNAGSSVSPAGDVDGDGHRDVLVGMRYGNGAFEDAGGAILVHGPVTGDIDLSVVGARFFGESEDAFAGYSVAGVGDTNGDGFDDLVVGAYKHEVGGDDLGAAYVIHGPVSGSRFLSSGSITYLGESDWSYAGYSVAPAGDLDNDGYADIVVGAMYDDGWRGAAYLIYGGP